MKGLNKKNVKPGQIVFHRTDLEGKHPLVVVDLFVDDPSMTHCEVSYISKTGTPKQEFIPFIALRESKDIQ